MLSRSKKKMTDSFKRVPVKWSAFYINFEL